MELIYRAVCGSGSNYFPELQMSIVAGLIFQVVAVCTAAECFPPIIRASVCLSKLLLPAVHLEIYLQCCCYTNREPSLGLSHCAVN